MPNYAVVVSDIAVVVWVGDAAGPVEACENALRQLGTRTGSLVSYEFEPPTHKEDGVDRLTLSVYDASAGTIERGHAEPGALKEENYVGTYMARY